MSESAKEADVVAIGKKRPKREVGHVYDARFHTQLMVGTKELAPNANAVDGGQEGFWLEVVADGIWVGHTRDGTSWTFAPWDSVRFVRYRRPDGSIDGSVK